jgi:ABC-2 type transport system ATP-binding protein
VEASLSASRITSSDTIVRLENVQKRFGSFQALEEISFELKKGEVLGFLGPNGAGKTTTMRILTGFFPPTKGKVWIHDKLFSKDPKKLKRLIGYLPETVHLYGDMRVHELLEFVAKIKGVAGRNVRKEVEQNIEKCGLTNMRKRLIGRLSKGYRQRVGLAQALVGDPEILVLDEPTTGLDPQQIIEIRELIRNLGKEKTLILSTHILPEVQMVCDRVLILNSGRVVASGTANELSSGLQDKLIVHITMGEPEKSSEAIALLEKIAGVESVVVSDKNKEQAILAVAVKEQADVRAECSRLFVLNNIPLLEIRSGHLSLEEIFMKIVEKHKEQQGKK